MKLKDYSVGQSISGYMAVKQCNIRQTNQNPPKDYLDLRLTYWPSPGRKHGYIHVS